MFAMDAVEESDEECASLSFVTLDSDLALPRAPRVSSFCRSLTIEVHSRHENGASFGASRAPRRISRGDEERRDGGHSRGRETDRRAEAEGNGRGAARSPRTQRNH